MANRGTTREDVLDMDMTCSFLAFPYRLSFVNGTFILFTNTLQLTRSRDATGRVLRVI
jgi:hypothetical protein